MKTHIGSTGNLIIQSRFFKNALNDMECMNFLFSFSSDSKQSGFRHLFLAYSKAISGIKMTPAFMKYHVLLLGLKEPVQEAVYDSVFFLDLG